MRVGSLFSGVGGMDEGLRRAGFEHVFFAEADPYRRDVLAARWPGATVYDDVRAVGEPPPRAEADERGAGAGEGGREAGAGLLVRGELGLLCGGFPCQDLSVAGRRAGLAGDRSGLFFEFARIIDALRPRWLLVENVPGLFSSNGGRDFGVVLGTLADLGYGVGWRVLDSRFFGVPQRRRRVFIVGARADEDPRAAAVRAGEVLAVGARCERHPATRGEAREDAPVASLSGLGNGGPDDNDGQAGRLVANALTTDGNRFGGADQDNYVADTVRSHPRPGSNSNGNVVANTLKSQRGKAGDGIGPEETLIADAVTAFHVTQDPISGDIAPAMGNGNQQGCATIGVQSGASVRRLTPTECERLQGLPDNWTQLGRTPDSRRYAALGDAVTANVAEWIGRRLIAADAEVPA